MTTQITRRELLAGLGAALAVKQPARAAAPASPVAVAKCKSYGSELLPTLERMFDQLGGMGRLVKGKTVTIKINLTGDVNYRLGYRPAELAHWTHPRVTAAVTHLLGKAGARRIRIVECPWSTADPLEEVMLQANWSPSMFLSAAPRVEFENTNWLGSGKKYVRVFPPHGGYIYKSYELNHCYEDTDVFVSIAKMKEHATTGVTLSMKNCFGITPCTIYGTGARDQGEPTKFPQGGREVFHRGRWQPPGNPEIDPNSPRDDGYRVPRIVADLVAARPIHLAVVEGIESMGGGEGPWIRGSYPNSPGLLVAGLNPVCTDAVCTALMGFDPMADRGTAPFEKCDSTLRLAEELGVGTRDLSRIEVIGTPIREAVYPFRQKGQPARGRS
ncbi:MAG TPA: DUF362 domain-containing protein [Bryobacteraceae bacterium]|nr:DUF362 domain-containing protein [Bryobacteraceae bacterium]HOQ46958.1 DUF362 domain-containing protein [Bryobacteraceae bacterium]HPU73115.1 DUF362 domain-containing protein [Bryobacteraceae bacterium]